MSKEPPTLKCFAVERTVLAIEGNAEKETPMEADTSTEEAPDPHAFVRAYPSFTYAVPVLPLHGTPAFRLMMCEIVAPAMARDARRGRGKFRRLTAALARARRERDRAIEELGRRAAALQHCAAG
jgi:hypothetical protein